MTRRREKFVFFHMGMRVGVGTVGAASDDKKPNVKATSLKNQYHKHIFQFITTGKNRHGIKYKKLYKLL